MIHKDAVAISEARSPHLVLQMLIITCISQACPNRTNRICLYGDILRNDCGGMRNPKSDAGGGLAVWRLRKELSLCLKAVCWGTRKNTFCIRSCKADRGQNSLLLERSISVLWRHSTNWIRPNHIMKDIWLYSNSTCLNDNLIQKVPSQKHPE